MHASYACQFTMSYDCTISCLTHRFNTSLQAIADYYPQQSIDTPDDKSGRKRHDSSISKVRQEIL